jgi:patatin-like phospholipase/acyl hydrolase
MPHLLYLLSSSLQNCDQQMGETSCVAIDGGLVMNNPTAAAITHVLQNKVEFLGFEGTKDMLV